MNKLFLNVLLSSVFVLSALAAVGVAQDPDSMPPKPAGGRGNALQQLGLSREQMVEIRKINQARRPQMEQAQERLRLANRALDAAIYSNSVSDEVFQARLKDFQTAQAEVARIRFANELAIRRLLNPEQLGRFRQIRERFEQTRQVRNNGMPPRRGLGLPKLKRTPPILK